MFAPKLSLFQTLLVVISISMAVYWIWIKFEFGSKGSRSFLRILRVVQIPIKILKKDLDPGSSDPFVRSLNTLVDSLRNWTLMAC